MPASACISELFAQEAARAVIIAPQFTSWAMARILASFTRSFAQKSPTLTYPEEPWGGGSLTPPQGCGGLWGKPGKGAGEGYMG